MYNSSPQAGLAALTASPYADSDVMNVQMTPREVAGLQQLAMSYGANEQDLYDPVTGQPRFNFLKKLLPMVIGAVLPGVPVLGNIASTVGFGNAAVGSALLVGGTTALIEGDLKKGLMAGLGAYSGANLAQSFQQAAIPTAEKLSPEELAKTNQAMEAAKQTVGARPVYNPTGTETDGLDYFKSANVYRGTPTAGDLAIGRQAIASGATTPDQILDYTKSANVFRGAPTPADLAAGRAAIASDTGIKGILQGGQNLFTSPDARRTFGQALGGGFQSPFAQSLSKQATFMGLADAFTPEVEMPSGYDLDDTVYIPGELNPNYGLGQQYGKFLPGQYYKRTKKGLVPYNPYQLAPGVRGAATGGLMQAPDQNMNQQRSIPHQYQPIPNPNQNYPLSTVVQANYQPNVPQQREVISGYEPKIDPYTGEERFAAGGAVNPFSASPAGTAPGAAGRGDPAMVAINAPYTEADARKRYEQMIYAPPPPPRNVQPIMDYIADLNRRAKNPPIYAYPPGGIVTPPGGGGGGGGPTGPGDKNEPGGGRGGGGSGPIAGGGGMPGGGIGGGIPGGGMGTGVGEGGSRGGGSGLPPGYQTGIGAGGSNYYDTFDPNIVESFPVKPDPDTPALVDEALGDNKAIKFVRKALGLDDPIGLGLGLVDPAAGLVWKMLPATTQQKVRNFVSGVFNLDDTPIVEAELEQEIKDAAEKEKSSQGETSVDRDRVSTRGKEGSTAGRGYTPPAFGPSTGGIGGLMGRRGVISIDENIRQSAKGGRIKAMQTGGMTAPNPYGAAVGEDFNFGFSGGGQTEYAAAGKLLEGEGDGMSDDIPAVIRGKGVQRAALADGEFVVPADVVSHLGNGSTKAGAKKLYAMMDRIREARTGKTRQAPAVKTERFLPA